MIPPLLVDIADDFEISVAVAGQLATVTFAAWAVSVVLVGPLSDTFGRRPVALAGLSVLTVAVIASAFAPNLQVLLLLRVITGLGGGMLPANSIGAVSDFISPAKRAQAVGGLMSFNVLAGVISVPMLALIAEWIDWQFAVLVSGFLLAAGVVLNWLWFPADTRERVRNFAFFSRYRSLLSLRFFRVAVAVVVSQRIAFWVMVTYLAAYLEDAHDWSTGRVALPLVIVGIGQAAGSYSAGFVAKRRDRAILIAVATITGGLCGLVFFSFEIGPWAAVAVAAVGTGLLSVTVTTLIAVSTEFSGQSRATGAGLLGFSNQSGGMLGNAFAGLLLANTGYGGLGYLCVGGNSNKRTGGGAFHEAAAEE